MIFFCKDDRIFHGELNRNFLENRVKNLPTQIIWKSSEMSVCLIPSTLIELINFVKMRLWISNKMLFNEDFFPIVNCGVTCIES